MTSREESESNHMQPFFMVTYIDVLPCGKGVKNWIAGAHGPDRVLSGMYDVNTIPGYRGLEATPNCRTLWVSLMGHDRCGGEYIWRIFDEINERPESVIDEIY